MMSQDIGQGHLPRPVQDGRAGETRVEGFWFGSANHCVKLPWKTVLRSTSALATFSISIFLLLGLKKRGLKHPLWLWLWIFDLLGAMILWCVWSSAFRHSHAFQFTGIILAFSLLAYVSEGFGSTMSEILPALPFVVVSGAFMASLLLSEKSAFLEDGVGQVVYTAFNDIVRG